MEFTLYYRGPLHSNGGPAEKHRLRKQFHQQLALLWKQLPLSEKRKSFLDKSVEDQSLNVLHQVAGFTFAPLVCQKLGLVAELTVTMLRPEPPGSIIVHGGDIDNRIKTLLDSLKVPTESTALPPDAAPEADEDPFFCVLEDDALVTSVTVQTERLLDPAAQKAEVVLLLKVLTKQLRVMFGTIGL